MKTLFLIYGGKSHENSVSLMTAKNISQVLPYQTYHIKPIYINQKGEWLTHDYLTKPAESVEELAFVSPEDHMTATNQIIGEKTTPLILTSVDSAIAFPVIHGENGEDGTIQGLFEILNIPYIGCGVVASACGLDKVMSKHLFAQAGLPQLPYIYFTKTDWLNNQVALLEQCQSELTYPMYIKPANSGSSVGITKAETLAELQKGIELALTYDRKIVVEQGVIARELEIALLGNDDAQASGVGEVVKVSDFYDFEEKYINNQTEIQIPANISNEISQTLRDYALKAYKAIDGSGLSRCDFFLTADNQIYINEINTLPGFTAFSMYPLLWQEQGIAYQQLIEKLIILAQERFDAKVN